MQVQKTDKAAVVEQTQKIEKVQPLEQPVLTLLVEIRQTLGILDRAVTNKQTRAISKLTRLVRKYRNVIQPHHILKICQATNIDCDRELLRRCKGFNESFSENFEISKGVQSRIGKVLELEAFIKILLLLIWWREHRYNECLSLSKQLLDKIMTANRRSLDNYSAILYFYFFRIHEKNHTVNVVREYLLESYNRCCVRIDQMGQATLLNVLLRDYLANNQIEAAHNLIEKTSFPQSKSNNEFCKYLLYTGRVKAVRREYGDALNRLNQAIRKSPDNARGFKIQCQKIAIVVELLLGEIPNREIFSDELIFSNAYPYYKLIQAVLEGSLSDYDKVVANYRQTFQKDSLYTLILRLNQIVIRIGLRKIYLSYSKISLKDISKKLNINEEDVEFIVAKALRDGILNGEIDHQNQILRIEGDLNVYVTNEPQLALNKRIKYCLGLYHETQRAITYPDMKMNVEENKEDQIDTSELLGLLDFDDDM